MSSLSKVTFARFDANAASMSARAATWRPSFTSTPTADVA